MHDQHLAVALPPRPREPFSHAQPDRGTVSGFLRRATVAQCNIKAPLHRPAVAEEIRKMQFAVVRYKQAQEGRPEPDKAALEALLDVLHVGTSFVESVASLNQDELVICFTSLENRLLTPEQQAVFDRHPPLAAWKARQLAEAAETDRRNHEALEQAQAVRLAARPAELVNAIRGRGVELAVDTQGRITAKPGEYITEAEREEIVTHKAAIVELLTPKPVPPVPVVKPMVLA